MNDRIDGEIGPVQELSASPVSRRRFLGGVGLAAGLALAAAACGDDEEETGSGQGAGQGGQTTPSPAGGGGDLAVASLAAGLEKLAVDTYKAALDAATANKLGPVPPAVATFVQTAMNQHMEHLNQWNMVLRSAGRPEVNTPNAQLKPTVDQMFGQVKDVAGAAKLALTLEEIAADTYLKAIPTIQDDNAVKLAAQILVVDQQHQSILRYALGEYPVPEVFQNPDKAVS